MPSWWTDTEERQYQHIMQSMMRKGGRSMNDIRRIAAARVNESHAKRKKKGKRRGRAPRA